MSDRFPADKVIYSLLGVFALSESLAGFALSFSKAVAGDTLGGGRMAIGASLLMALGVYGLATVREIVMRERRRKNLRSSGDEPDELDAL